LAINDALFSSKSREWETPQALFDKLNNFFHFTLDVAATKKNAKCQKFFTPEDNGLLQNWHRDICWMNPPYGREIAKWIKKAYDESKLGATVVMLLPARTDTAYFHDFIYHKAEIYFLRGRLKFEGAKNSAPFPSMIAIFWGFGGRPRNVPNWE